jgi:Protein of unknown function (DUF3747)
MHISLNLRLLALATLVLCGSATTAIAAPLFGQQEIDQSKFALAASPYGGNAHQLLVIEQISSARQCWSESGNSPTLINPLLGEFDFTNICGRSIDSNGYSIRTGGEDLNWRYSVRAVRRGNDIVLLGVPTSDRSAPELLIGRTRGYTPGFAKFYLEPGWRLTKRSYEGTSTGHLYLTNNQALASLNAAAIATRPVSPAPIATNPLPPVAVVNPGGVFNPIGGNPVVDIPSPTAPPKPAQKRRKSWWEQLFGDRKSTSATQYAGATSNSAPSSASSLSTSPSNRFVPSPVAPTTNATGDLVVPTLSILQP